MLKKLKISKHNKCLAEPIQPVKYKCEQVVDS